MNRTELDASLVVLLGTVTPSKSRLCVKTASGPVYSDSDNQSLQNDVDRLSVEPDTDTSFEEQMEEEVRKADRDLYMFVAIVSIAVVIGIAMNIIPPAALASLLIGAVLIWQKNR